jgi:HEAT repeat protein
MSMTRNRDQDDPQQIVRLVHQLDGQNWLRSHDAREELVDIGRAAVPALVEALHDPDEHVRWEAAKALGEISDSSAAPALVEALLDPNFGVRWLAAEGLITMRRRGLKPLLQALIDRSDSVWLRQGAHHIFRTLATSGPHQEIEPVLKALTGPEPIVEVPPAAAAVLKKLEERRPAAQQS